MTMRRALRHLALAAPERFYTLLLLPTFAGGMAYPMGLNALMSDTPDALTHALHAIAVARGSGHAVLQAFAVDALRLLGNKWAA